MILGVVGSSTPRRRAIAAGLIQQWRPERSLILGRTGLGAAVWETSDSLQIPVTSFYPDPNRFRDPVSWEIAGEQLLVVGKPDLVVCLEPSSLQTVALQRMAKLGAKLVVGRQDSPAASVRWSTWPG